MFAFFCYDTSMSFQDIIWGLLPWSLLAIYCISVTGLLLWAGYTLYKRVLHGRGRLSDVQWLAISFLIGYAAVVLGLTNFSRVLGATKSVNLILFFAYFDAFVTGSIKAWQLILFNVIMFIPLGFLLPFASKKTDGLKAALLIGLAFSLLIECLQLINSTGIFELDDLFHNTLGAGVGYCAYALLFGRKVFSRGRRRGKGRVVAG